MRTLLLLFAFALMGMLLPASITAHGRHGSDPNKDRYRHHGSSKDTVDDVALELLSQLLRSKPVGDIFLSKPTGILTVGIDAVAEPTACNLAGLTASFVGDMCVKDDKTGNYQTYSCATGSMPTMITYSGVNCTGTQTPVPLPFEANVCSASQSNGHWNIILASCFN